MVFIGILPGRGDKKYIESIRNFFDGKIIKYEKGRVKGINSAEDKGTQPELLLWLFCERP